MYQAPSQFLEIYLYCLSPVEYRCNALNHRVCPHKEAQLSYKSLAAQPHNWFNFYQPELLSTFVFCTGEASTRGLVKKTKKPLNYCSRHLRIKNWPLSFKVVYPECLTTWLYYLVQKLLQRYLVQEKWSSDSPSDCYEHRLPFKVAAPGFPVIRHLIRLIWIYLLKIKISLNKITF